MQRIGASSGAGGGSSRRGEAWPLLTSELMNFDGFVDTRAGLLVVGGLSHMGLSWGEVLRASQVPGGDWMAETMAELPTAPIAWTRAPDGDLLLLTESGEAFALDGAGRPRALAADIKVVCGACEGPTER